MAINNTVENINNQPTIKPRTISGIFTRYIAKTLPLAFDESMSYYECLCALLEYLNETIVPDINNTNDGLSELQNLYLQLQDYVNNYFDNLDVQEEINNKLDDMVEDGTMDQIINQEIFADINERLDLTYNQLNHRKFIFIGDSYLQGYTPDGYVSGWGVYVAQYLGLSADQYSSHIQSQSGSGFVAGSTTFQGIMEQLPDDETITDVVVCGGYNDRNSSEAALISAIASFKASMLQKFPNAKLSIGFIGWSNDPQKMFVNANTARRYIIASEANGAIYLKNVEYALHEYFTVWASDGYHPNEEGDKRLGRAIGEALISGSASVYLQWGEFIQTYIEFAEAFNTTAEDRQITLMGMVDNITYLKSEQLVFKCPNGVSLGHNWTEVGTFKMGCIIGSNYSFIDFSVPCILQDTTTSRFLSRVVSFRIKDKKLYIRLNSINSYDTPQSGYETLNVKNIEIEGFNLTLPSLMS